jgi:hypothetical protein
MFRNINWTYVLVGLVAGVWATKAFPAVMGRMGGYFTNPYAVRNWMRFKGQAPVAELGQFGKGPLSMMERRERAQNVASWMHYGGPTTQYSAY